MMIAKKITLLVFALICIDAAIASAQISLKGTVSDATTNQTLPYVNIGIAHKNIGTVSQSDGSFKIDIPKENENDTLTFSIVGYNDEKYPVKALPADGNIHLTSKTTNLAEVNIISAQLTKKKFGEANYHALVQFTDGSTNQKDIFEIGQLIKLDTVLSKITSVNLYISAARADSGIFRINFYGYDGRHPTGRIVDKSIIQKHAITKGWLTFDLKPYHVYLKGNL